MCASDIQLSQSSSDVRPLGVGIGKDSGEKDIPRASAEAKPTPSADSEQKEKDVPSRALKNRPVDVDNWMRDSEIGTLSADARAVFQMVLCRCVDALGDGRPHRTGDSKGPVAGDTVLPLRSAVRQTPRLAGEAGADEQRPTRLQLGSSRPNEIVLEARALMAKLGGMSREDKVCFLLDEFPYHVMKMINIEAITDAVGLVVVVCDGLITWYGDNVRSLVFDIFGWLDNALHGRGIHSDDERARRLAVTGDTLVDLPAGSREDLFIFTWPYHEAIRLLRKEEGEDRMSVRLARNCVHNMHAAIAKSDLFDADRLWPPIERRLEALDAVLSMKIGEESDPAVWGNLASYLALKEQKTAFSPDTEVAQHLQGALAAMRVKAMGYVSSELFNAGVALLRRKNRGQYVEVRAYINCLGALSLVKIGYAQTQATSERGFLDCMVNMFGAVSDMVVPPAIQASARACNASAVAMCMATGRSVDAERLRGSFRDMFRGQEEKGDVAWKDFGEHLGKLAVWLDEKVKQKYPGIGLVPLTEDLKTFEGNVTCVGEALSKDAWEAIKKALEGLRKDAQRDFASLVEEYYPLERHPLVKGDKSDGKPEGILSLTEEQQKELLRPLQSAQGSLRETMRRHLGE